MLKTFAGGILGLLLLTSGAAAQSCASLPYTLTNGTTADATQVMANFNCAALTSGATIGDATLTGTTTLPGPGIINSGGFFGMGTTTNGGWAGNARAEFSISTAATNALSAYNAGPGGSAIIVRVDYTNSNALTVTYDGSGVGSISTNGSSTAFNTTSDARLKDINVEQRNYRDVIGELWVGNFRWKKDNAPGFGILAQQAYPLFPEAIRKPTTADSLWQADYSKLAPLALWGVKDLYKTASSQGRHIASLEREVTKLHRVNDNEAAEIQSLEVKVSELERKAEIRTAKSE